jgi:RHS repeat-associated protein
MHIGAASLHPDNLSYLGRGGWNYVVPTLQMNQSWVFVGPPPPQQCFSYDNFIFGDLQGTLHPIGLEVNPGSTPGCFIAGQSWPQQFTTSSDGFVTGNTPSGTSNNFDHPSQVTVSDLDGTVYFFDTNNISRFHGVDGIGGVSTLWSGLPDWMETRNGNKVTFTDNGNGAIQVTDTLGRVAVSTSGFGASGNTVSISGLSNPYTLSWANKSYSFSVTSQSIHPSTMSGGATCFNGGTSTLSGSVSEVTQITLPNGQSYQFQYDPTYAVLSKIIYPTGAYVRYVWGTNNSSTSDVTVAHENPNTGIPPNPSSDICEGIWPSVALQHRYVSFDGVNEVLQQDFSYAATTWALTGIGQAPYQQWTTKQTTVTTHDLVAGTTQITVYTYAAAAVPELGNIPQQESGSGVHPVTPVESQVQYQNGSGTTLHTVRKVYGNPFLPPVDQVTILDNGQTSETQNCFITTQWHGTGSLCPNQTGSANLLTDTYQLDYGSGASGPQLRHTHMDYASFAATPLGGTILNRPCRTIAYDGGGNKVAETDLLYDGGTIVCGAAGTPATAAVANLPSGTHDETNYGATSTAVRGNLTKAIHKCFIPATTQTCTDAATAYTYDETGQMLSMVDPVGNATNDAAHHTTTYSYTDSYTEGVPSGATNAYVTQITYPQTNSINHIVKYSYAFADGKVTKFTDQNSQATQYFYSDAWRRPTEIDYPDGGKTTLNYNSDALPLTITKTVTASPSPNIVTSTIFDGFGRVHKSVLSSDPEGSIFIRTDYDGEGRQLKTWNPTRCDPDISPNSCSGENTFGTTQYAYDALSRVTSVTRPDGSVSSTSYTGRATKVTDEGNGTYQVQRISQTDSLGRLVALCEVSATTQAGSSNNVPAACNLDIPGTGFLTTYQYDAFTDIVAVSAAGITNRTFAYDSLSRPLCTSNPEMSKTTTCPNPDSGTYTPGTIRYAYDANGNLTSKKAPAPNQTDPAVTVTITYSFDALNRLFQRQYSDLTTTSGTPTAHIDYDSSSELGVTGLLNVVDRKSGEYVTDGNGNKLAGSVFSYDAMGRIKTNSQCTPQNCPSSGVFAIGYTYDANGQLLSASDGEGVVVSYSYDGAGHLTSATSNLVDSNHPATLFSNASYGPIGLTQSSLGNGLTETQTYHQRGWLQSRQIANPNGAPGTGSVTISGSLQSQTNPGTPGAATITIGGPAIQSASAPDGSTIYDSGDVWININGNDQESVSYQGPYVGCTAFYNTTGAYYTSWVAAVLANCISYYSPYVTASVSGSTISITAKANGSNTNYSLSAGSDYDTTDGYSDPNTGMWTPYFTQPSFTATASGPTLTGGQNGSTTYDSGATTITVNNHPDSYSWSGSSTTAASIAQGLCNNINNDGGAFVKASTNGTPGQCPLGSTTISLVSKVSGASTNYTLTASSSSGMNSFSTSTSGGNLTGGMNLVNLYSFNLTFAPDGNIGSANDSVNGNFTYTYDDMNRLHTAVANTGTGCIESYDRYGNRWSQQPYGSGNSCGTSSLSFTGNNTTNNNRIDGYSYDAAGNLLNDGLGHSLTYDAENRLINVGGNSTATYIYDSGGQRVRRITSSGTLDYLYDLAGHAITEITGSGSPTRGEVYASDRHLASYQSGTTYFDHTDWINNERLRTTVAGTTFSNWTSLPFGEGSSTPNPGPLHFTGQVRDTETGLDYFGARYYGSNAGRFMSPDPSGLLAQRPANPQSWNLYAYAMNNPVINIDPNGLDCIYVNDAGNGVESIDHNSSAGECADTEGTWVPGYADEDWAKFNPDTGLFQVGSIDGTGDDATVDYTMFAPGARTGENGNCLSGCGGYDFGSYNANWLRSNLVGASRGMGLDGLIEFMVGRMEPIHGLFGLHDPGFGMQMLSGGLDFWNDHWAGPGGMGVPHGQTDWTAMVHDYNFFTNGITIGSYFNPRLPKPTRQALVQSNNKLIKNARGIQKVKMGLFFGAVNAFQWVFHPHF